MLGRVVPTLKSGIGIESNALGDGPCDSVACGASLGQIAKLNMSARKSVLPMSEWRLDVSSKGPNELRQRRVGKVVSRLFREECRLC